MLIHLRRGLSLLMSNRAGGTHPASRRQPSETQIRQWPRSDSKSGVAVFCSNYRWTSVLSKLRHEAWYGQLAMFWTYVSRGENKVVRLPPASFEITADLTSPPPREGPTSPSEPRQK